MTQVQIIKEVFFWLFFIILALVVSRPEIMNAIKIGAWEEIYKRDESNYNAKQKAFKKHTLDQIENNKWVEKKLFIVYTIIFLTVRIIFF
jgi:hypothetical protein